MKPEYINLAIGAFQIVTSFYMWGVHKQTVRINKKAKANLEDTEKFRNDDVDLYLDLRVAKADRIVKENLTKDGDSIKVNGSVIAKEVGEKKGAEKTKIVKSYPAGKIEICANKQNWGEIGGGVYYTEYLVLFVDLTNKKLISSDETHKYKIIETHLDLIKDSLYDFGTEAFLANLVSGTMHFSDDEDWKKHIASDSKIRADFAEKYYNLFRETEKRESQKKAEEERVGNEIHFWEFFAGTVEGEDFYKQYGKYYTDGHGRFLLADSCAGKEIAAWNLQCFTRKAETLPFYSNQYINLKTGNYFLSHINKKLTETDEWNKMWNPKYKYKGRK